MSRLQMAAARSSGRALVPQSAEVGEARQWAAFRGQGRSSRLSTPLPRLLRNVELQRRARPASNDFVAEHRVSVFTCQFVFTMRPVSTTWRQLGLQRRHFSSSPRRLDNYAFIGLGQMVSTSCSAQAHTRGTQLTRLLPGIPNGPQPPSQTPSERQSENI